jgi:ubiquinone biosynthesis protein
MATRPDLLPREVVEEMALLQESAEPFPWAEAREVITAEAGAAPNELFASIEETAAAAASMAQIHLALLHDGREVVVKVQRPGIRGVIERDLGLITHLAYLIERSFPESKSYRPVEIVEQFRRSIFRELDFQLEGTVTDAIRENLAAVPEVVVPEVVWELTTPRMLTLERLTGISPGDPEALLAAGIDPAAVARTLASVFMRQVIVDGLFHADPHPGNLLALSGNQVAIIDFGMAGRLEEESRLALAGILGALAARDYDGIARGYLRLTSTVLDDEALRAFRRDLTDFLEPLLDRPLARIPLGEAIRQAFSVAIRHRLQVPPEFFLLVRCIVTLEGTVRRLDPSFSVMEAVAPLAGEVMRQRLDPARLAREAARTFGDALSLLRSFPENIQTLLRKLIRGEVRIDLVHVGLDGLQHELDRSTNRIAFAVVTSAIIIGSSLILTIDKGWMLFGYPLLGILGYLVAGFMGLWLLVAIIRSGRL